MPQLLKDEVEERILAAALEVFAQQGFEGASMAEIARRAAISTGNTYRYFKNKEALFQALLPEGFVTRFKRLLKGRVEALAGTEDIRSLPPSARYHLLSEELLAFCVEHRLQVVILLSRAKGTPHAVLFDDVVAALSAHAIAHFHDLASAHAVQVPSDFVLQAIYRNFVRTMSEILSEHSVPETIRQAIAEYATYHLSGLRDLFLRGPMGASAEA